MTCVKPAKPLERAVFTKSVTVYEQSVASLALQSHRVMRHPPQIKAHPVRQHRERARLPRFYRLTLLAL